MTDDLPVFIFRECKCGHRFIRHGLGDGEPCLMPGCFCTAYRQTKTSDD